jgi:hypothetical protein
MYVSGKMILLKPFRNGREGIKSNGRYEFKYDVFDIL